MTRHTTSIAMPSGGKVTEVDLAGPHGGLLALSFAAGCVFTAGLARVLWGWLVGPLIARLEAQIADLKAALEKEQDRRREDRDRCDREIAEIREHAARECETMRLTIEKLQTALLLGGPPQLRQAVQAALSETRVALDPQE